MHRCMPTMGPQKREQNWDPRVKIGSALTTREQLQAYIVPQCEGPVLCTEAEGSVSDSQNQTVERRERGARKSLQRLGDTGRRIATGLHFIDF